MPKTGIESDLHERMLIVVGDRTYRLVGELTDTHPETVRRYLQGQSPSVEFITALCGAFGINTEWLLRATGPKRCCDALGESLRVASSSQLLGVIGSTLDALGERIASLEAAMDRLQGTGATGTSPASIETKGLRLQASVLSTNQSLATG